jgi:hypothetical protein
VKEPARTTSAKDARNRALRAETLGLILLALLILGFYLVRYYHLAHRGTP